MKWKMRAIATVDNDIKETPDDWSKVTSRLVLRKAYVEGLYKLSHFKHVWVIFGFDRNNQIRMKIRPRHDRTKPLVGVFASRSPTRPNKLGLTLVELVSVRKNIVTVRGLDAFDGSPIFDLKPYEEEIDY